MHTLITPLVSNYFLTLYLIAFVVAGIVLALKPKPLAPGAVVEALFSSYLIRDRAHISPELRVPHVFWRDGG